MNYLQIFKPISLVALWAATSSFINFGMADERNISSSDDSPSPSSTSSVDDPECAARGVFFNLEGILWKAQESGLSFATTSAVGTAQNTPGSGSMQNLNFEWNFGFKAGFGFNIPHGNWDTFFNYTWLKNRAHSSVAGSATTAVLPNFASAFMSTGPVTSAPAPTTLTLHQPTATGASAHWKLALNVGDWELGKQFAPFQWFTFRPFAGVKGAWVHQNYDVDYTGFTTGTSLTSSDYTVTLKNNYWGVGPRVGFDSKFLLGCGFSIFGNAAASLLYGRFSLDHVEHVTNVTADLNTVNFSNEYMAGRAVTELQLGLRWESKICKEKFHVAFQAGWEQQIFFEQGEFMRFTDPSNPGHFTQEHDDLSLQGGTLSLEFGF